MGKVQVVIEFEHQARQNICPIIFSAAFNQVNCECNLIMESCRDSIKTTSQRVKAEVQKGANPGVAETVMKRPVTILKSWIRRSIFSRGP